MFHEVFYIKERREEYVEEFVKVLLVIRQGLAQHDFHEIAKIVSGVEGDPVNVIEEDESRAHKQGSKVQRIDAVLFVERKVDTSLGQHASRFLSVHVVFERELEVKLPGTWCGYQDAIIPFRVRMRSRNWRNFPILGEEGDSKLYHL